MQDLSWIYIYLLIIILVAVIISAIFIYKRIKLNERQLVLGSSVLVAIGVTLICALTLPLFIVTGAFPLVFQNDLNLANLFIIGFILIGLMALCGIFGFVRFYRKIRLDSGQTDERIHVEKKFILAQALAGISLFLLFAIYYWDFWNFTPYQNYFSINGLFQTFYSGFYLINPMDSVIYSLLIILAISQAFYAAGPPLLSELMHKLEQIEKKSEPIDYAEEDFVDYLPFQAYIGDEPYLFVSYSHQDKKLVYPVLKRMHEAKVRIWYDEGIPPSGKWIEQIASTLKKCEMFLIFITNSAVASKHVRNEIYFANKNDKKVFPIYLEKTDLPDELDIQIGRFQALFKFIMNEKIFYRKLLQQLVKVSS